MRPIISVALSKLHGGMAAPSVARSLAREIVAKSELKMPPFDPFVVARKLNVSVTYGDIAAEAVLKGFDSANPQIVVAGTAFDYLGQSYRRRVNFTVAHEIGHFAIRKAVTGFVPKSVFETEHEDEERLCNDFASELLMPRSCILATLQRLGFSPRSLLETANEYEVSLTALLTRVAKLWSPFFAAILWTRDKFRIKPYWAFPSESSRAVLCDNGHTSVERAFNSGEEEESAGDLIIGGRRFRWPCISLKLQGSELVLSVLYRTSVGARKLLPSMPSDGMSSNSEGVRILLPVQQILPFPESKTLIAARRRKGQSGRKIGLLMD